MGLKWQKAGPNHVPSYQVSGIPFVTSSTTTDVLCPDDNGASLVTKVSFPYVTKALTIRNIGKNPLRVGFSERGIFNPGSTERLTALHGGVAKPANESKNYFVIPASGSSALSPLTSLKHTFTFDVRCKEIYFVSDAGPDNDPAATKATLGTGFTLLAELTTIPASNFPILTGSLNGTGSFEGIG